MRLLVIALTALGFGALVAGWLLIVNADATSTWDDVGKALMAIGGTALIGGAVATWLKWNERSREVREAWAELLQDVVDTDQKLSIACQLINAHKTAKTYSEQHVKILEAGDTLRRVWSDPLVAGYEAREGQLSLRHHLDVMKKYLDHLRKEYEEEYLAAARQQRIDEQYLKVRIETLVGG